MAHKIPLELELEKDLELAWALFTTSQESGDESMAIEYMRLAMDAEERLARLDTRMRKQA